MATITRREPSMDPIGSHRPPVRRNRSAAVPSIVLLMVAAALAAAAWYFWFGPGAQQDKPAATPTPPAQNTPAVAAPQVPAADLAPTPPAEPLAPRDISAALIQLLGRDAAMRFLELTDFPRRAVATLDNLARDHAPVMAWPVVPTPGRFSVAGDGASSTLAPDNAQRYSAFVGFVGAIDPKQAVDVYRRMYPVLQREYRELGFTDRTLHTRLFEVINLLLATPEPAQPPRLTLVQVNGPVPSTQPWTRYEFEDPALQRLTAGQKMLLRVGADNRRVLKAKLEAIRQELLRTSTSAARP